MIIGARPDALMPSMSLHCMLCLYIAAGLQVSQYSSVVSALLYLSHSFLLPLRYHDAAAEAVLLQGRKQRQAFAQNVSVCPYVQCTW